MLLIIHMVYPKLHNFKSVLSPFRLIKAVNPSLPKTSWGGGEGEGEEHVLQGGKAGIPEENADRIYF